VHGDGSAGMSFIPGLLTPELAASQQHLDPAMLAQLLNSGLDLSLLFGAHAPGAFGGAPPPPEYYGGSEAGAGGGGGPDAQDAANLDEIESAMQQAEIEAFLDAQGVFNVSCVFAACCVGVSLDVPGPLRLVPSWPAASLLEASLPSRKLANKRHSPPANACHERLCATWENGGHCGPAPHADCLHLDACPARVAAPVPRAKDLCRLLSCLSAGARSLPREKGHARPSACLAANQ